MVISQSTFYEDSASIIGFFTIVAFIHTVQTTQRLNLLGPHLCLLEIHHGKYILESAVGTKEERLHWSAQHYPTRALLALSRNCQVFASN
jgi:hypothetical protein